MSLKAKLVSTVAAFLMVLALMVVGVFAATSGSIQMGGSLTFNATDVVGRVDLATVGNSGGEITKTTEDFDATDDSVDFSWTTGEGEAIDLVFSEGTDITVKITVTNKASDRPMYVTFGSVEPSITDPVNVDVTAITYGGTPGTPVTLDKAVEVEYGTPVVFSFTFSVQNDNLGASGSWSLNMSLSNENPNA